jgi:inosine/xanthosine triphosphatase
MKVFVASTNPVKVAAVEQGFRMTFPEGEFSFEGVKADSGVKDQPDTDEETVQGARNRIAHVRSIHPDGEYYAALEGGIERMNGKMFAFAWIVVEDRSGKIGEARTGTFELPQAIAQRIDQGIELGIANDQVFGTENSKHKNGALGILTNDLITRTSEYANTVILALIPFQKHKDLYGMTK